MGRQTTFRNGRQTSGCQVLEGGAQEEVGEVGICTKGRHKGHFTLMELFYMLTLMMNRET